VSSLVSENEVSEITIETGRQRKKKEHSLRERNAGEREEGGGRSWVTREFFYLQHIPGAPDNGR
jgi:hypothetical protein